MIRFFFFIFNDGKLIYDRRGSARIRLPDDL